MQISKKRHSALYSAISKPIVTLRIENGSGFSIEEMDKKLLELENKIYQRVAMALDLHKS